MSEPFVEITRDYRGGACPLNFLRIQRDLLPLPVGTLFTALLDDGAPIRNVPKSLKGEGHEIVEQKEMGGYWLLTIRKGQCS